MNNNHLQEYEKAASQFADRGGKREKDFYVQWHITDRCNLKCKHCYTGEPSRGDLPLSQLQDIFDKYLKALLKWELKGMISLTGGEPLLRSDFFELLDYIHEKWKEHPCFYVSLMSNGTLINEEFVSRLKSYWPMLTQVQVSLDGACEETHDFVRGKGSFAKAKNSLFLLREKGFITALHFVVHKSNYEDAFHILELGEALKVTRVTISRLVPEGRGGTLEMLSPSQLKDLWNYLSTKCLDLFPKGIFLARGRCDLWHLVDIGSALYSLKWCVKEGTLPQYLEVGQRCPVGINGLTVNADGSVYPCRRLPITIGNVTTDTFFTIWYSSKLLWQFRYKERHMKGKCQDCPFLTDEELRYLCAGGSPCISYAECGDCFMPDPQCWFDPLSEEQREEVEKWKKLILEQEKTYSS
jgi:radical SAM protein with 4Fe4S-binding SPASM domain